MLSRNIAYVRVGAPGRIGRRTGPRAARSTRPTSRRGSSPGRTPRGRPRRDIGTTSACRTARNATTAATCSRCAMSPTAAAMSGRSTPTTASRSRRCCRVEYGGGVRPLRLSERSQPAQPARRSHGHAGRSMRGSRRQRRAGRSRQAPRSSCRLAIPASGCRRSARSHRSTRAAAFNAEQTTHADVDRRTRLRRVDVVGARVPPARRRSARDGLRRGDPRPARREGWTLRRRQRGRRRRDAAARWRSAR